MSLAVFSRFRKSTVLTSRHNLFFLHFIWALPVSILIRLLRPWLTVRFCEFCADRIGHFAADAGQHWAAQQLGQANYLDLFYYIPSRLCNSYWPVIVKRHVRCFDWVAILDFCSRRLPGSSFHELPASQSGSRDLHGFLERSPKLMSFLPHEASEGRNWLMRHGWTLGDPFVCLLVRDDAYLGNDPLHASPSKWSYHSYRNSDINTYTEAVNWLSSQGVWVLRMGKIMAAPMACTASRFIDYSMSTEKSDFLDIWLTANCNLCISTGTGIDMVSDVFRRPILFLNYMPLSHMTTWSDATHFFKILRWRDSGIPLTCTETVENSFSSTDSYYDAGIDIFDLSSAQILEAVKECWLRMNGAWDDTDLDSLRHQELMKILLNHPRAKHLHGYIHPRARIGTTWLRSMEDRFIA